MIDSGKKFLMVLLAVLAFLPARAEELLNYPLDTINGEEVYRYQVERSIGLYRVGVNFNVTQSEIIRFNPQLRERGLHFGETLFIPTGRKIGEAAPATSPEPAPADTVITVMQDSLLVQDSTATDTTVVTRRVVELALMLPFESQQTKRSGNADRMLEFYQGALLALRDLQDDSTLYRLRVYDTERSERKVRELCDSTELDSVRGILGLVYPIQIDIMAPWCEKHQVPLLLPFSDEMDLKGHPHVYQFNSPDKDEARALAQWIANREDRNCVLVETRESDISPSIRLLRQELKAQNIPYTTLPIRDLLNDSAGLAIDSFQENIFVLHSDRYQQARILLPHIARLPVAKLLVSQYAWQKEEIDLRQVYTSKFASETDLAEYDRQWEETYKNQHVSKMPRYDLLGYDLMRELVHIIRHEAGEQHPLQSPINWESTSEQDGWQNTYINIIEK